MRCEYCHGLGEVLVNARGQRVALKDAVLLVFCPVCGGSGWDYCCGGEHATAPHPEEPPPA